MPCSDSLARADEQLAIAVAIISSHADRLNLATSIDNARLLTP